LRGEDEEEHEGQKMKKATKFGVGGSPLHTMVLQSSG